MPLEIGEVWVVRKALRVYDPVYCFLKHLLHAVANVQFLLALTGHSVHSEAETAHLTFFQALLTRKALYGDLRNATAFLLAVLDCPVATFLQ